MDERTPNLLIIGAPKAGTTFVHHALGLVPDVYMSAVKEPGFFSSSRDYGRGVEYYLDAYFAKAAGHQVRGESTPWYLYSERAMERIATVTAGQPVRLLVLVRRPSDRAVSMYRDQVRIAREHRPFEEAIESELAGLERGEVGPDVRLRYVWCSRYADHIDRWRAAFGPESVHVSVFEDLAASPLQVWDELCSFLQVDLGRCRFGDVSERDRNASGGLRWPRLDRTLRSMEGRDNPLIERAKRVLPPGLHRRVLQQVGRMNRTPGSSEPLTAPDELLARIDEACLASTERISRLLDRPLHEWVAPGPSSGT